MVDRKELVMRAKMWRDIGYENSLVSFREIETKFVS